MNNCGENQPKPCQATSWKPHQVSSQKSPGVSCYQRTSSFPAVPTCRAKPVSDLKAGLGEGWAWPKHPSLLKFIACAVGPCMFCPSPVSLTKRFICTSTKTMLPMLLISCSTKASQEFSDQSVSPAVDIRLVPWLLLPLPSLAWHILGDTAALQPLPPFGSGSEASVLDPTLGRRLDWKPPGSSPAWIIPWPCVRSHRHNVGLKPG